MACPFSGVAESQFPTGVPSAPDFNRTATRCRGLKYAEPFQFQRLPTPDLIHKYKLIREQEDLSVACKGFEIG